MQDDHASLVRDAAERALARMRRQGFDAAQVCATHTALQEINVHHNEPSLQRSTLALRLSLLGLLDGRKAATEVSGVGEVTDEDLDRTVPALFDDARGAPQDAANAVSSGQAADLALGPPRADARALGDSVAELLELRHRDAPKVMLEEAQAWHTLAHSRTLTSGGSDIARRLGWYAMSMMATAREGARSSSFAMASGTAFDLRAMPVDHLFGIGDTLRATQRQIDTAAIGECFVGDVVFAPAAVADVLAWLLAQIGDMQLIAGTSLYRDAVGSEIASPLLSVRSRFDGPGSAPVSPDACLAPAVELLSSGRLMVLTPSLYGSRRTGLPHTPVADGWEMAAGRTPLADMIAGVPRGAIVGRLSMGNPASNGDFSAVLKNSFAITGGELGPALAETMISGNMARLLREVSAVSQERVDAGATWLPWLRIGGLHFS